MTIISRETCCACDTDNSGEPVHSLSAPSWPLKTCRQCHLVYLTRVPDYETTGTEFAFEKTGQAESVRRDQARPVERRISNALKWFRSKVMKRNRALAMAMKHARKADATVVDIGCGGGAILASMPFTFKVIGIEISAELASQTREKLSRQRGRSEIYHADAISGLRELPASTADVVLMISYLEHEINPLSALKASLHALRAGGRCIVKVPNFSSWNLALKKKEWCGFRFPDHVNYFTPATLSDLARRAGFDVLPIPLSHRFPTSDNMWVVLQAPRSSLA